MFVSRIACADTFLPRFFLFFDPQRNVMLNTLKINFPVNSTFQTVPVLEKRDEDRSRSFSKLMTKLIIHHDGER